MYLDDDEAHIKRERAKAKELKKSRWWQNLISTSPKCYYCQKVLKKEEVTMDHVVPLSRGGLTTKGNIVPACRPCNQEKRGSTAVDLLLEG